MARDVRRGAAMVFALALGARLAVVAWAASRIPPAADGTFYHTIAGRIARGLGYTWLWPDGAVTHAGHYPIGYPALVGAVYAIAGPHPAAAMVLNALLGALAAVAAYRLAERAGGPRAAVAAGVLVALHPGLLAYTPALMTEGVTASLVACAAWAASEASARAGASERQASEAPARAGAGERQPSEASARAGAGERQPSEASARAGAGERQPSEASARAGAGATASRRWRWVVLIGVITGIATLVRPQSLVLAPLFGWLAAGESGGARPWLRLPQVGAPSRARWARIGGAAVALVAALAVCAPWTARNCVQMKRCALVSHNGGWNLLIGTNAKGNGAWAELEVPPECREVFDEAEKDVCFGAAARRIIAERPGAWLALAPKKLAATFDYAGAGGWYLHAANKDAFPERAKVLAGAIETVFERAVLLLALFVAVRGPLARLRERRRRPFVARAAAAPEVAAYGEGAERGVTAHGAAITRRGSSPELAALALALVGALAAFQRHAWIGYIALGALLLAASLGRIDRVRGEAYRSEVTGGGVLITATAVVLLSLVATHAVFFGAGRYSLVAFPGVTAVAALAFGRRAA